jgi:hypothetical protein
MNEARESEALRVEEAVADHGAHEVSGDPTEHSTSQSHASNSPKADNSADLNDDSTAVGGPAPSSITTTGSATGASTAVPTQPPQQSPGVPEGADATSSWVAVSPPTNSNTQRSHVGFDPTNADSAPLPTHDTNTEQHEENQGKMPSRVPSVAELEAPLSVEEELREARLVQRITELCHARGLFVFPRVSVMCLALGLEEDVSPDRVGRWAVRRILVPAASLARAPGSADEAQARTWWTDIHGAAASTLASTADLGAKVASTAAVWGSWLMRPVVDAASSAPSILLTPLMATTRAIGWGAKSAEAAPPPLATAANNNTNKDDDAPASVETDLPAGSTSAIATPLNSRSRFGAPRYESPNKDSAVSFGVAEHNLLGSALDAAFDAMCPGALGGPIVFRPALHRAAAEAVTSLIQRCKRGGAIARVIPEDDWYEFLSEHGVSHLDEMTNFLVLHVQVAERVSCALGQGFFLTALLSEDSRAMLWTEDVVRTLLEFRLCVVAVSLAVTGWEEELEVLQRIHDPSITAAKDQLARINTLRGLIQENKLVHIELTKTSKRAAEASAIDPKQVADLIRNRFEPFGPLAEFPITELPPRA